MNTTLPRPRSLRRRLAWMLVLCYLLFTGYALGHEPRWTFDPPWFITLLNAGSWLSAGGVVAYLSATVYTRTGAAAALLLGCGMLLVGLGSPLSGVVLGPLGVNAAVTMHNLVVLLGGGCLLGAASLFLFPAPTGTPGARRGQVATGYLTVLAVLGALYLLVRADALPVFFQQGVGPTPLRQWVVGGAVVAFAVAGGFAWQAYALRRIDFFRWYGTGLLLAALGLAVVLQQHRVGGLVSWAGRGGQFLGGLYIMAAVALTWRDARQRRIGLGDVFAVTLSPTGMLQAALEAVPAMVWIAHDRAGRQISGNRAAQTLLQLPPGAELARAGNWAEQLAHVRARHRGVAVAWEELPIAQVAATGEAVFEYPLDLAFADGGVRSLVGNVTPVLGAAGTTEGAIAVFLDVTDQRQAQDRLRESEERYRALFNAMTEGFALHEIVTDDAGAPVDYRFLDVNPAFERLTGLKRADVLGRCVREVLPTIESVWIETYGAVALTGEPARLESFAAPLNRWYEVVAYQPAPRQFAAILADVTARKQAEAALRDSERRYRAIGESIPFGVWVCAPDGRNIYASESFLKLVGITQEQCSSFGWGDVLHPDDAAHTISAWKECVRTGGTWDVQHRFRGVDGEWHPILARGVPVRDDSGQITCWAGINLDISQLKQAEAALERAKAELEQRVAVRTAELSRAVARLSIQSEELHALASELTLTEQRERVRLAEVIHDGLQQLIVAAKLRVGLLGRDADPRLREGCQDIGRLLDEAAANARSLTADLSPPILRTGGLFGGLQWLTRWSQEKHHVAVRLTSSATPLPPLPEDVTVLLFQSVRELLFNAVKYAEVAEAAVTLAWAPPDLTLTVADTGVGFDPTTLRGEGGTGGGFGLARIRHRLELLGGCMHIASAPGQGTRVTLAVRVLPADQPARRAPHPQPHGGVPADRAPEPAGPGKLRLLVVDDHQVVRHALIQMLRAEPDLAVVGEAGTGTAAVALVRQLAPDVVLMDINMPEMDGIEATRAIHAACPTLRVIGLSMYDRGDQQAAMQAAGAVAYLSKTAPAEALLAAIRGRRGGTEDEHPSSPTPEVAQ
jgi:PAS domain S-box-containing protein